MHPQGLTAELWTILHRQAEAGSPRAVSALHAIELGDRTGCRYGCAERGVSTYCSLHYQGEDS